MAKESNTNNSGLEGLAGLLDTSISRRSLLRLAGLSAAGLALASCASATSTPAGVQGQPVQLVYQDSNTDWFQPMVTKMLDEFHATHPNIRVFFVPEPDDPKDKQEKMLADMQAGTAPDVFQGCCSWFPIWAQNGYCLDLRQYVSDLDKETIADWDPAQYKAFFTRDGRQYALPKFHGALALYYNKDLFDKYKVDYPDGTWDHNTYLDAMRRLTPAYNGDTSTRTWGSMLYMTWDRIQMHVNDWGGHLIDPKDPTQCLMGQPEAVAAIEWIRARMQDDKVMARVSDVQKKFPSDAFAAGDIAMVEDGSWALKSILSASNFRMGVAPMPIGPVQRVTLTTTDGFGIYSGTKHPEAAWELVKFLIGKDFGRAMAKEAFLQPAKASLVDEWVDLVRAGFPDKAKDMDLAVFAEGHRKGYSVVAEVAANMAEATRIAESAFDQVLALGQQPIGYITEAAEQINQAQQSSQASVDCPDCDKQKSAAGT